MALWLVRAGPHGEEEHGALQYNVATIGWNEMPDVSKIGSKDILKELYLKLHPNDKKMSCKNGRTNMGFCKRD